MNAQEKDKILQYIADNQKLNEQIIILLDRLIRTVTQPKIGLEEWEKIDLSEAIDEASEQVERGFKAVAQMNASMYKYVTKIEIREEEV